MAFDKALADKVRELVAPRGDVTERQMFGGIAWMINGNMACGVMGQELLVRVDKEDSDAALAEHHTRLFDMGGRPMTGFIIVAPDGIAEEEELASWVDRGANYAASLDEK